MKHHKAHSTRHTGPLRIGDNAPLPLAVEGRGATPPRPKAGLLLPIMLFAAISAADTEALPLPPPAPTPPRPAAQDIELSTSGSKECLLT